TVGAWAAILGGRGALGGAGGWRGAQVGAGHSNVQSLGARSGRQAIADGHAVAVRLLGVPWPQGRVGQRGKGIDTKGPGKTGNVGATLAAVIPELYNLTDWAVSSAGNGLRGLVA